MSIKGLDVSRFQGEVDWERVKAAGYRFAMLRAGYGDSTVDEQFRRNASECNRIGLPIGAYWFCYAATAENAAKEADSCIRTVSGYRLDYPVCYDIEQASADYVKKLGISFTPALARELVKSFCNAVESKDILPCSTPIRASSTPISAPRWRNGMRSGTRATRIHSTDGLRDLAVHQRRPGARDQRKCGSGPGLCGLSGRDPQGRAQPPVGNRAGSAGTVPRAAVHYLRDPARRYIERDRAEYGTTVDALAKLNGISDRIRSTPAGRSGFRKTAVPPRYTIPSGRAIR